MMKTTDLRPDESWLDEWREDISSRRAEALARELLALFGDFWEHAAFGAMSRTTQRRHADSLAALGRELIMRSREATGRRSARVLLLDTVEAADGPLLFPDDETWQRELDATCRRLLRWLTGDSRG
ncbi:MAG: hypothetical protein ACYDIE_02855 [Candidatus Krumholzibacteriia bacterium]